MRRGRGSSLYQAINTRAEARPLFKAPARPGLAAGHAGCLRADFGRCSWVCAGVGQGGHRSSAPVRGAPGGTGMASRKRGGCKRRLSCLATPVTIAWQLRSRSLPRRSLGQRQPEPTKSAQVSAGGGRLGQEAQAALGGAAQPPWGTQGHGDSVCREALARLHQNRGSSWEPRLLGRQATGDRPRLCGDTSQGSRRGMDAAANPMITQSESEPSGHGPDRRRGAPRGEAARGRSRARAPALCSAFGHRT